MARMVPPVVHPGTRSQGEREVFRRLRDDPVTKDWVVLHSLDVAEHIKNISGEIDFAIIIPQKGVLCLEVKGASRVRRRHGLWFYGGDTRPDARGPFKQASEAMHSVRLRLLERRPDLAQVLFYSAVLFPYVNFSSKSDEWHPWQVIDASLFRRDSLGNLLLNVLDKAREHIGSRPGATWFHPESGAPYQEQCLALAEALRPDFEFYEPPLSRAERLEEELKTYTAEQYEALDALEANPRVVFGGPAGTGKTLLAIEATRRGFAAGRRVLFVCYNRLLGQWLEEQTAAWAPMVKAGTLHSFMGSIAGRKGAPSNAEHSYWNLELPRLAVERILNSPDQTETFDEIVIDEAQDILSDEYLDVLDLVLQGGLASGRWRIFGDMEKQAIYGSYNSSPNEVLSRRCGNNPVFSLRVNCRNTPRVAELAHLLGGLNPPYWKVLRADDGVEPELRFSSSRGEQAALLKQTLKVLSSEFIAQDIVVLSVKSDYACLAAWLESESWKNKLRRYEARGKDCIGYASVYAFKGLEAPAIVVTDVDRVSGEFAMSLFYIAVTRALQRLVVLADMSVKRELARALLDVSHA